jgi:hypothetical protein
VETDRSYAERLSTLYADYRGGWRTLFGEPVSAAAPTSSELREQLWEGEGGSLDTPAPKKQEPV